MSELNLEAEIAERDELIQRAKSTVKWARNKLNLAEASSLEIDLYLAEHQSKRKLHEGRRGTSNISDISRAGNLLRTG